jgi:hypothetical protein
METAVAVVSEMKSKKPSTLSHNKHHNNTNMSKRQQLISELRTLKKQQQLQRKQLELYKLQKKQRKLLKKQQQKQQQTQQQQEEEEQGANTTSNEQQPIPATVTSTMNDSSSASNDNGPAPSIPTVNAQEMTKESSKAEQEQQNPSPPPDEEKESKPTVTAALANEEQMICTSHLASIMEAETATMPTITEATIDLSTVQTQETPNEEMPTSNKPATAAPSPPGHLEDKEPSNAIHGNNDNSSNTTNHSALHPSHSQSSAMSYQNSSSMNNNSMVYPYSWPLQLPQQHHNHHQQLPQMPQYPWHFHPRPFDTIGTYPSLWNYTSHPYLLNPHPVALFPGTDPSLRYLAPWQQQNHAHYAGATSKDAWNQTPSEPAPVKPPPTQMALARGTTTTSNRVDAKKKLAATRLASTPCEPPSPFAKTHDILNEILHVVKPDDANSSFGVILKLDMRSILMENSEILNPATSTNNATANADPMIPQKPRRRKRFFFSVLMVSDPSVHNKRRLEAVNTDDKSTTSHPPLLLQTDDIVLEINGTSTANLSFHEACSLFKTCTASTHIEGINQKMIVCPIRVARRRLSPPKKPLALAVPAILQNRMLPSKGPLDKQETLELALGAFWANWDPRRLLGQPPSSSLLGQITFHSLTSSVLLNNRGHSFDLEAAWNGIRNQIETQIKRAAAEYWNEKWKNMPEPHWTDAKLAALRAKPRPSSGGCRCGSKDHRYVNDPKCPLYCDLVSVAPESGEAKENEFILSERDILAQRRRVLSKSLHEAEKELNVVQKAFTERIIRIQTESEVDLVEAKFINRMEKVQLSRLQQAVAAPKSLTAMVLSAIFELEAEFDDGENQGPLLQLPQKPTVLFENKRVTPEKNLTSNIDSVDRDSDDEDDDVPLAALGKRMPDPDDSLPNDSLHSEKRRRGNPSIVLNALYLARMIQFLSHKWGHVYREPSNEEYLWYVFSLLVSYSWKKGVVVFSHGSFEIRLIISP